MFSVNEVKKHLTQHLSYIVPESNYLKINVFLLGHVELGLNRLNSKAHQTEVETRVPK